MNIVLVGMMGAGKTSVARRLGWALNYEVADTDYLIEKNQKQTINEIFSSCGVEFFRNLETEVIKNYLNHQKLVMATGGGILLTEGNLSLLKQIGYVIYLKVRRSTLFIRLKRSKRRPLFDASNTQKFYDLVDQREHIYEEADLVINTSHLSVQAVANRIILMHKSKFDRPNGVINESI
ncbi:MAG: shikimate kinase [SAR324 cluster bacterium]|nr:shikimate kinase [SAR324 cluster bacterium]